MTKIFSCFYFPLAIPMLAKFHVQLAEFLFSHFVFLSFVHNFFSFFFSKPRARENNCERVLHC